MLFPHLSTGYWWFALIVALWTIPWKGVALWKAARAGSKPWFVALLVLNTLAALEILYIFVFSEKVGPAHAKPHPHRDHHK